MPFKDILKRQVDNLLSTERNRPHVSLERDLRGEFDRQLSNVIDPGREAREAAREAASIERTRTQQGFGQFVTIIGIAGQWEAVELFHSDETSAAFSLVDRDSGDSAQLAAVDDGTVVLDWPGGQHGAAIPGAYWRNGTTVGIRLAAATLTSTGEQPLTVTADLSAAVPMEDDYTEDYSEET